MNSNGVQAIAYCDAYGSSSSVVGFGLQWGYWMDASGLILCTHRYYDPQQGRFVTRDPIGYAGGINLYGYVRNNPGNESDPLGLRGYMVVDHNGSYTMDVPDSQSVDRNIRSALAWLSAHPKATLSDKEAYVSSQVHGGAYPTVGDYKDYKDVHCSQLRQERDLAGNFNFGAISEALGVNEILMAGAGHLFHVKDTYGAGGGGLAGLKAVLRDPLHPDDRQQAIEDGAEYEIAAYQHYIGRNTIISVRVIK